MEQIAEFIVYIDRSGVFISTKYTEDRGYETAVFPTDRMGVKSTKCDVDWYDSVEEARVGHEKMILKYQKDGMIMSVDDYINFMA